MFEQSLTHQIAISGITRLAEAIERLGTRLPPRSRRPPPNAAARGPAMYQLPELPERPANEGHPLVFGPGAADHLLGRWLRRGLDRLTGEHPFQRELDRKLAVPRQRPLDRRLSGRLSYEDDSGCIRVLFTEHEHGLTVTCEAFYRFSAVVELDERHARILCLWLLHKVEGRPAYGRHWDHPITFLDKNGSGGRLTVYEDHDGLLFSAEPAQGPWIFVRLDNWSVRSLCRTLDDQVEGRPRQPSQPS